MESGPALQSVTWGWGLGGGGGGGGRGGRGQGYLADRYVTLIFNFICLVFSLSIERFVQLRRVAIMRYE